MPQINRIRVNNVKYNFGTQFYDDFMMRFNCSNTLYDLANGGGKSLLMLMLMQTVIPNCTLDDKQPVEKLFRAGGGNTVIHSLVEWKLDACYRKDNYKYMTTGFCARKARSADDVNDSAENMATEGVVTKESSGIEYFNYVIFYREFNDNDIRNLPLTSNGERITYNGLKAYLRELEKKDFNVSVKIFERKGDYQAFLTRYGIFESQWEIVRGINKTEGHVRTYFETSYRTSRKVVEDLLIEEIIQKSFNNRLGVDNDEGTMAKTLLDIKDKLLELSRKHSTINNYDCQIQAIEAFAEFVEGYRSVYEKKTAYEKELFELLKACKYEVAAQEAEQQKQEKLIERMNNELENENRQILTAQVVSQEQSLEALNKLIKVSEMSLEASDKEIQGLYEKLRLQESVNDYAEYNEFLKLTEQLQVMLENTTRGSDDIVNELKKISAEMRMRMSDRQTLLEEKCSLYDNRIKVCLSEQKTLKEEYEDVLRQQSSGAGLKTFAKDRINELEGKNKVLMQEAGLIVAENAQAEESSINEQLVVLRDELESINSRLDNKRQELNRCLAQVEGIQLHNRLVNEEITKNEAVSGADANAAERYEGIKNIYGMAGNKTLADTVFEYYRKADWECRETSEQADSINAFIENAKAGTYVCKDPVRDRLAEYLHSNYGEDVEEGHEWFRKLNNGQRRDVLKRVPFVEYGFIVKNDFERIKQDINLANFARGAYCVPVISEQILYDTKLEVNRDLIEFALKDMSFLRDDARLEAELAIAAEELENLKHRLMKAQDRRNVIFDDYNFIVSYNAAAWTDRRKNAEQLKAVIAENNNKLGIIQESIEILKQDILELTNESQQKSAFIEELKKKSYLLNRIAELKRETDDWYDKMNEASEVLQQYDEKLIDIRQKLAAVEENLKQATNSYASFAETKEQLIKKWKEDYAPYYDEAVNKSDCMENNAEWSDEQLESRFYGLLAALKTENAQVSDKQELIKQYRLSMEKCCRDIGYRGSDFNSVKEIFEKGEVLPAKPEQLYEIKNEIKRLEVSTKSERDELDSQCALMNRLEGSIAHSISVIEEKYGEYVSFNYDNPDNFVTQHRQMVGRLKDSIRETQKKLAERDGNLKSIYVIEKDLERIVEAAGMSIPVIHEDEDYVLTESAAGRIPEYEAVSKDYNRHLKLIGKKADEFIRRRENLTELLKSYDAAELATQIKISVELPDSVHKTEKLANNLRETNEFIALERDRVSKGIEDMERIKDNFENRCIQTCSNIRTELERLPKLSTITLDDELISIISLQIPYVREDNYKERMSEYIDETIMMADSFRSQEERLKYIRNRLTWKKLFSVIVTDMNSIRINLYKRERIKDQSRYLRYEEAVGSTGQSQGIYIQFLIAVINYIASINASSDTQGITGKTIFIDNPFGAAKDIYIWEPIFKLLKTNHVQLIVPARGATPAITGRFDVNYILGQRLVDKRQQTVVVDYYSKTNQAAMEYVKMDYEQAVFDFIQ